jgi:ectoine hydroxylase-related dioxygenase (phytanoyl-CoA dioxygenase family)
MEERYWELREEMDRAFDKWYGQSTRSNYLAYEKAQDNFKDFCVVILEKLMEENADVLKDLEDSLTNRQECAIISPRGENND